MLSAHHRTTLSGYVFATKACIDNRKNLLTAITSPHVLIIMTNFGPLAAEIYWRVGVPQQLSTGFASSLRYSTDVAQRRSTKLCKMSGRLVGWYTIHTFWQLFLLMKFCQLQNSLCVQVLYSPILAALLHGTRAAAVSQTLWRGTRNGIRELLQSSYIGGALCKRAPPIYGWTAITLGIGPHSS